MWQKNGMIFLSNDSHRIFSLIPIKTNEMRKCWMKIACYFLCLKLKRMISSVFVFSILFYWTHVILVLYDLFLLIFCRLVLCFIVPRISWVTLNLRGRMVPLLERHEIGRQRLLLMHLIYCGTTSTQRWQPKWCHLNRSSAKFVGRTKMFIDQLECIDLLWIFHHSDTPAF